MMHWKKNMLRTWMHENETRKIKLRKKIQSLEFQRDKTIRTIQVVTEEVRILRKQMDGFKSRFDYEDCQRKIERREADIIVLKKQYRKYCREIQPLRQKLFALSS